MPTRPGDPTVPGRGAPDGVLRRFFRDAQDLFAVYDLQGRFLEVNDAWGRVLGHEPAELIGRCSWDLVDPATEIGVRRAAEAELLARGRTDLVLRLRTRAGDSREVAWVLQLDAGLGRCFGVGRDVTEVRRRQEVERDSHRFFESANDLLLVLDERSHIVRANPAAGETLGFPADRLVGRRLIDLVHPDDRAEAVARGNEALRTGRPVHLTVRWLAADGGYRWIDVTSVLSGRPGDVVIHVVGRDVSEQQRMTDELRTLASTDPLTGLANRTQLLHRLDGLIDRGRPAAVLLVDLDRFKVVNDSLGHAAGDELLVALAHRLLALCGPDDVAARLGGDEFVLVVGGVDSAAEAARRAADVLDALRRPLEVMGRELHPCASVGGALTRGRTAPAGDLLREADTAAYRAKELGRDRYELFDDRLRADAQRRLAVEAGLRVALREDELDAVFQPIVALDGGTVRSVEALVRWHRPMEGEPWLPGAFMGVAEETGLVVPLGARVLDRACAALARWRAAGLDVTVSVNCAARQLALPDLVDQVAVLLAGHGLDPAHLVLEVTESALVEDVERTRGRMEALRRLGVRLAIDDFGTGFSSLSYLCRLPVDIVKIDRSFVADVETSRPTRAVVAAVVTLAGALDLEVVAEGIETASQAEALRDLGCDLGQGFHLHRPQSADAVLATVLAGSRRPEDGLRPRSDGVEPLRGEMPPPSVSHPPFILTP